ncbi:MAG: hypothetical protein WDM81_10435 [Rhizomicrobium sp.]
MRPRIGGEADQRGYPRQVVDDQRLADLADPGEARPHMRLGVVEVRLAQQTLHRFRLAEVGGEAGGAQQPFAFGHGRAAHARRVLQRDDRGRQRAAPLRPRRGGVEFLGQGFVGPDGRGQAMPQGTVPTGR